LAWRRIGGARVGSSSPHLQLCGAHLPGAAARGGGGGAALGRRGGDPRRRPFAERLVHAGTRGRTLPLPLLLPLLPLEALACVGGGAAAEGDDSCGQLAAGQLRQ